MSEQNIISGEWEKSAPFDLPNTPSAQQESSPVPFVDTPLLKAKRRAFDCPSQQNLEALILEAGMAVAASLRKDADGLEAKASEEFARPGNIIPLKNYPKMQLAVALRITANYLEGNSGS